MINIFIAKIKYFLPVLVAIAAFLPTIALAKGETYEWQDSTRQAIVGRGGNFSVDTVFRLTDPTKVAFSPGIQSFGCEPAGKPRVDFDPKLQITMEPVDYNAKAAQTPGKLTYETPPDCRLEFDPAVTVVEPGASKVAATSAETCQAGDLSWIICGVYKYLSSSIEWIENKVIAPFLRIEPLTTNLANNPQYTIWRQVRNIANIGFALVFLVIIFANTLSLKLDYYTIKKMIPRLVAATILVQFSYLLVGLAIDVTNVMGAGLHDLMLAGIKDHPEVQVTTLVGGAGLAAGLAVAFAAAGSILTGGILIVAITAFFAMLAIFMTLVFRQVLVTFLLIISPLAFVAWVLPNTDNIFRLWSRTLIRTLMMYPMIVALFAAGKIFSAAAAAAGSGGAASSDMQSLLGVIANIAPLILIPATFKAAGGAFIAGAATIQRLAGGSRGMFEKGGAYERLRNRTEQRKIELAAGQKVRGFGLITGNRAAVHLARGPLNPSGYGSGANVRAMAQFSKDRAGWTKRLDEEDMTYEGYEVLSRGLEFGEDARRKALNSGDTAKAARYRDGLDQAKRYINVTPARAAAAMKLSDMGVITDNDRANLLRYTAPTAAGHLVASQVWGRAKEGARKSNVHLAYTDVEGNLDKVGLEKFVTSKTSNVWQEYSTDAYKRMYDEGILQNVASDRAGRFLLRNLMSDRGGPTTGAQQQQIIRQALDDTAAEHSELDKEVERTRPGGST